jgi:hypothetical protein
MPEVVRTEAQEDAYRRYMQEVDRVAARLEQDDSGGSAQTQADRERRLAAEDTPLEREEEAREAA